MKGSDRFRRLVRVVGAGVILAVGLISIAAFSDEARAFWPCRASPRPHTWVGPAHVVGDDPDCPDWAGAWYWLRSPEEERRVVARLYNLYCRRCHADDGRGVWDMPDVPDFTDLRWQACRSDAQLARIILEGRGAVMPAFRGTLTLEESWAMARYLRTFVPGTETPRPDDREPTQPPEQLPAPAPVKPAAAPAQSRPR